MSPFRYAQVTDAETAMASAATPGALYIAGGTNVLDLMKDDVERPSMLIDITGLPYKTIDVTPAGVRIGALMTMADTADAPAVAQNYPAVAQSLLLAASAQLRNMATIGGNVLQRTRCAYFRDVSQPCNKRQPGLGCAAIGGQNRLHSVIGTSEHCICSHPSDLAVALLAVDAVVHTRSANGARTIPMDDLHVLPGDTPNLETVLGRGELIEAIELPASAHARNSTYVKVRDRASYEFALVSVAAGLEIAGGTIRTARVALGSVAPKPWRARGAEAVLAGRAATAQTFEDAGRAATAGMRGYGYNDFKIALTQRAVVRALQTIAGAA